MKSGGIAGNLSGVSHLAQAREVFDVTGAGDTVIATATIIYALTRNVHLMAEIANIAGGLVCEEVGVVSIKKDRLLLESEFILLK